MSQAAGIRTPLYPTAVLNFYWPIYSRFPLPSEGAEERFGVLFTANYRPSTSHIEVGVLRPVILSRGSLAALFPTHMPRKWWASSA